jgi:HAD superfamily phosphoserine phosphatase-like hydrolase
VLVSASPDVYLRDWAAAHGVADVLCTALEHDAGGRMTGRLQGRNCYGEEKVRRIRAWLQDRAIPARTYAYGDTRGDLPMLHFVDEGYRVRDALERVSRSAI